MSMLSFRHMNLEGFKRIPVHVQRMPTLLLIVPMKMNDFHYSNVTVVPQAGHNFKRDML